MRTAKTSSNCWTRNIASMKLTSLIGIKYHTDGKLFNLRRLPAKIKILTNIIRNLLMTVLKASTEADMQCRFDRFSRARAKFILTIRTKKTELLPQPVPGKPRAEPNITLNGQRLNTYLGSTLSQNAATDDKVKGHKRQLSLWETMPVFGTEEISSTQTQLKVYRAVILPTLLIGNVDRVPTPCKKVPDRSSAVSERTGFQTLRISPKQVSPAVSPS